MARKKAQHVIPQSYLKPWCDPQTPDGMEPYVWLISKDGNTTRKRSPKKSFTETDMYTIRLPDGGRELIVEDSLAQIEGRYVDLVTSKLARRQRLTPEEYAELCVFGAAMSVRTKSQQTHWQKTFDHQHRIVTQLERAHGAPPRTSLRTAAISAHAHQFAIANVLAVMPPLLFQMFHAVLETDDKLGFITSDRPCVIYNPDMYKWPPMYRNPGLGLEKTEVTLPLSPRQLLLISHHHDLRGYRPVPAALVDEINRRTRFYCEQVFVSWTDKTRPVWFDPGLGESADVKVSRSQCWSHLRAPVPPAGLSLRKPRPHQRHPRLLLPIPCAGKTARYPRRILHEVRLGCMLHVPHRHRDRRVPEQLLDSRDRHPRLGGVHSERVPQVMQRDLVKSRTPARPGEHTPRRPIVIERRSEEKIVRPDRVPGDVLGEETRQGLRNRHVPHAARRLQRTYTLAHGDSPLGQPYLPTPQPLRLPDPQSRERQGREQRPPLPRRGALEIP